MSYRDAVARISELQSLAVQTMAPTAVRPRTPAPVSTAFPAVLARTLQSAAPAGPGLLAAAESQIGTTEEPPGSNDGPRIADYRSAVAGAAAGEPWCAYFVSWAAAQAGTPLGDTGQGFGSVPELTRWAERTGRLEASGTQPQPGDLVLFGNRHVGIVESVAADGTLTTVEGNYAQGVSRVTRAPGEATGFVRVG